MAGWIPSLTVYTSQVQHSRGYVSQMLCRGQRPDIVCQLSVPQSSHNPHRNSMTIPASVKTPKARLVLDLLIGLGLRGGGALASFVLTWLIARQFGAGVVGQYQIGLTTATLAAMVATFGLHLVLVREGGKLITSQQLGHLAATYRACRKFVLAGGFGIFLVVIGVAVTLAATVLTDASPILFVLAFAPSIIMFAWLRLNNELLRSLGDVWRSQLLEGVFYTGLTAMILATLWIADISYSAFGIIAVYLASVALALFISVRIISSKLETWGDGSTQIGMTDGIIAIAPAVIMTAVDWIILLIVGIFLSIADAGIYRTLVMYGALINMISASFAIMTGPHLAKARAAGDRAQFFSTVNSASLLGLLMASPLVLAAIFMPEFILGLFGPDFLPGAQALGILALAQLVGVATGPAAPAMMMMHREKPVLYIEIIASIASIPLAYVLVQQVGLIGPPMAVLAAGLLRGTYTRWALWRAWRA